MHVENWDECAKIIAKIRKDLNDIEMLVNWSVDSQDRFSLGDRVRFSEFGIRRGHAAGRKNGVQTGKVVGFHHNRGIRVLLDGYKTAIGFHHAIFDKV